MIIRISDPDPDQDPFHFGQPDTDPSRKNQAKSWKFSTKVNLNH